MADLIQYIGVRVVEIVSNIDYLGIGQNMANAAAMAVDAAHHEYENYNKYAAEAARLEMEAARELEEEPVPIDISDVDDKK